MTLRKLLKVIPKHEKVTFIRMGQGTVNDDGIMVRSNIITETAGLSDYGRKVEMVFASLDSNDEPMTVVILGDYKNGNLNTRRSGE